MDPVFERIEMLLREQSRTQQDLLSALGLNRSTYSNWKLGKSKTYLKQFDSISNYFNVSPSYLLRGIEDGPMDGTKGATEDEMIRVFRKLNPKRQDLLIQVGRTLLCD